MKKILNSFFIACCGVLLAFTLGLAVCMVCSCDSEKKPVHTGTYVLYISSAYRDNFHQNYPEQRFTVSTSPECKDTVMVLTRKVSSMNAPFVYNVGDTVHLNFN